MDIWPCDEHLAKWWKWRQAQLAKKQKRKREDVNKKKTKKEKKKKRDEDAGPEPCTCGPDASRALCFRFFNATRKFWPMFWKDERLRATVDVCEERLGLPTVEMTDMDPEDAYNYFFGLARGSLWTSVPKEVDEYWRYMRMVPLHTDMSCRAPDNDIGWHSLACNPVGALAVSLNNVACKEHDTILYMWVPIVPAQTYKSIFWSFHYGTLLVAHKDWHSQEDRRKAWSDRDFRSKYEWCRASNQTMDERAKVLRLPLLSFAKPKHIKNFINGKTPAGTRRPSPSCEAFKPEPPFVVRNQSGAGLGPLATHSFMRDLASLQHSAPAVDLDQLHKRCMHEWKGHSIPWRGLLAGLLTPRGGDRGTHRPDEDDADEEAGSAGDPFQDGEEERRSKRLRGAKQSFSTDDDGGEDPQPRLRQTQLNLPGQSSRSGQHPWPESKLKPESITKIKDWLINVRGYGKAARNWHWEKVEEAVRKEGRKIEGEEAAREDRKVEGEEAVREDRKTEGEEAVQEGRTEGEEAARKEDRKVEGEEAAREDRKIKGEEAARREDGTGDETGTLVP
ncbi:uncharacterized protein N0V89_011794 [Didymosphaeria variabile]|uniref:Uncharacterized protein n=1 Tax=Didymosphaeria variabile TaxID=1932322 RepID=A0A9W8XAL8_9PLEO|nr:uncharacterized protein N0V89_011794 [Didymosphaeria variabile]KAJ4345659.1 hypothetical protein N0V89_011794 [Didymosphaeria variabile]